MCLRELNWAKECSCCQSKVLPTCNTQRSPPLLGALFAPISTYITGTREVTCDFPDLNCFKGVKDVDVTTLMKMGLELILLR